MRCVTLALVAGSLVAGCGDTGPTEEDLRGAYQRGYAAGELTNRNRAAATAREAWQAGYEVGYGDGAAVVFEEVERALGFGEGDRRLQAEEIQLEAEEAIQDAEAANEAAEELEEAAER